MSVLPQQIQALSLPEKIQLVQDLWNDILTSTEDIPLTPSQIEVLDARLEQHQAAPEDILPWINLKQRLLSQ